MTLKTCQCIFVINTISALKNKSTTVETTFKKIKPLSRFQFKKEKNHAKPKPTDFFGTACLFQSSSQNCSQHNGSFKKIRSQQFYCKEISRQMSLL